MRVHMHPKIPIGLNPCMATLILHHPRAIEMVAVRTPFLVLYNTKGGMSNNLSIYVRISSIPRHHLCDYVQELGLKVASLGTELASSLGKSAGQDSPPSHTHLPVTTKYKVMSQTI